MAYFEDLQPCTAFPGEWRNLVAVGWLAKGHEYTRGPVDAELLPLLSRTSSRWMPPNAPGGRHLCDLCTEDEGPRYGRGAIFIPGDGVLYVAPQLITHYIRKHGYQPPAAFLEALRAVPEDPHVYRSTVAGHLVGHVEERRDPNVYDARDIQVLEGFEAVRLRPAMYIGPLDPHGLERMLSLIVDISINQHLGAGATRLTVDINDAGWVTVENDGDGLPIEPRTPHLLSVPELMFGTLLMGPPITEHPPAAGSVRHGPETAVSAIATALSSRFEVETRRDGVAYRLAYAAGFPLHPLVKVGPTPMRGTVVRYRPDDEIFEAGVRHDLGRVERRLIDVARLCPKLDVQFQGRSLRRPEGLSSWLREAAPELVTETMLTASGTVKDVGVEVAFAWRPRSSSSLIRSFVNYGETEEGGSHVRGLVSAVEQVISAKRASRKKKVLSGLVGIVHVGIRYPRMERSGMRLSLNDENARVAVRDVVTRAINEAPWWWDKLHTAIG
jgi:hypothetical protein